MEILGIGLSELIFVVIIALLVLGPKDMQKAGMTIGKWLRRIVASDGWKAFQHTTRELRALPYKLMREANEDLNKIGNEIRAASTPDSDWLEVPKPHPRSKPVSGGAPPRTNGAEKAPPPSPKDTEGENTIHA